MPEEKRRYEGLWMLAEASVWSSAWGIGFFFIKDLPTSTNPWYKLVWVFASVATGTLTLFIRRFSSFTREARARMEAVSSRAQFLLEAYKNFGPAEKLFLSLHPSRTCDYSLCSFLSGRIIQHIWVIPQVTAERAYQVLEEALGMSEFWEGIQWQNLDELGQHPLDEKAAASFFMKLQKHLEKNRKFRLIMLEHDTFERYTNLKLKGPEEVTTIQKFWGKTGKYVECYFFDLSRMDLLSGFSIEERNRLRDRTMRWPDCAIHNGRYFISYRRNSGDKSDKSVSEVRGSSSADNFQGEGLIEIWTTDLDVNFNGADPSLYARAARALFDVLAERRRKRSFSPEFYKIDQKYINRVLSLSFPRSS